MFHGFRTFPLFIVFYLFTELDDVLHQMGQTVAPSSPDIFDTNDISGDESAARQPCLRVRLKRTYKMLKVWGQMHWASFLSLLLRMRLANPTSFLSHLAQRRVGNDTGLV